MLQVLIFGGLGMLFREQPAVAAIVVTYSLSTDADALADNAVYFYIFGGINETFRAKVRGCLNEIVECSLLACSVEKHTTGSNKNPKVLIRLYCI